LSAVEVKTVIDREDLALLVEVILEGHEMVAGATGEGTVLDGL